MSKVARNIVLSISAVLMIALQPLTLIAMVIAPRCSGVAQLADTYKVASVLVFGGAYYILVLRRFSLIAAVTIPAVQIAMGWFFLGYINGLPLGCPQ